MATKTIEGRAVVNSLSSGPGCAPHTYELSDGAYVYEIAGKWYLQERGQHRRPTAELRTAIVR